MLGTKTIRSTPVFRQQRQEPPVHEELGKLASPKRRICAVLLDEAGKAAGLRQLESSMVLQIVGLGNLPNTVRICYNADLLDIFREDVLTLSVCAENLP